MTLYKRLFSIATPIAIQQIIFASVNFLDTLMVGQLGETALAAVGLSNQVFFVYNLLLFGLTSGGAVFVAQYWGRRETDHISTTTALTLSLALLFSVPFFVPGFFFSAQTLRLFTPDPEVLQVGKEYLAVISIGFFASAFSLTFYSVLRSTEHAFVAMFISVTAILTNVVLNFLLIFGNLGFPRLGVFGAGIATLVARILEMVLVLVVVFGKRFPGSLKWESFRKIHLGFFKRYMKVTLPTMGNELFWSLGITMYSVVYGHISTRVLSAQRILNSIESFTFSLLFAIASGTAVILGQSLGLSRFEQTKSEAARVLRLSFILSVSVGVVLFLLSPLLLSLYNVPGEVKSLAQTLILLSMLFLPLKNLNLMFVVGTLRAGGDTRFSFLVESGSLWLAGVPLTALAGLVWRFPFPVVYAMTLVEETLKLVFLFRRYISGKWLKNVVDSPS
ncbi:MAG TPA: MATE family efflux transporter [Thermotogota bacterium]|nr:MATE family efflux transporter [Thermotogota bacterium]HRW91952.1 MATE family efflux transporter [Thermotogota bacterium]